MVGQNTCILLVVVNVRMGERATACVLCLTGILSIRISHPSRIVHFKCGGCTKGEGGESDGDGDYSVWAPSYPLKETAGDGGIFNQILLQFIAIPHLSTNFLSRSSKFKDRVIVLNRVRNR